MKDDILDVAFALLGLCLIWGLAFGVTVGGTHYTVSCTAHGGVNLSEAPSNPPADGAKH